MPSRPLLLYPDPRLRQPALRIDKFGSDLAALANDVLDTLTAVSAIGLTAPHIGVLRRVMVVRMASEDAARTYVNPSVLRMSTETERHDEGSVSMPGVRETVERPARIRIAYQDISGASTEEDLAGFAAAVLLHEIDQLDGIFWIDRLSRLKRDRTISRFNKMQRRA